MINRAASEIESLVNQLYEVNPAAAEAFLIAHGFHFADDAEDRALVESSAKFVALRLRFIETLTNNGLNADDFEMNLLTHAFRTEFPNGCVSSTSEFLSFAESFRIGGEAR
ncbi:hypothetical protein ACVXZ4_04120 [Lacisediminihabitans sp. FW035]